MDDDKPIEYNSRNHLVAKSNALIESARIKFSVMQQRIIHTALSQIHKGHRLTDELMYKIPISVIRDLAGQEASGAFYQRTKSAAKTLLRSPMTIKQNPDGSKRKRILECNIVQSIEYDDEEGMLWIRFNHDAIPYLSGLEGIGFTQYSLEAGLLHMDSAYAYRLHDLIARWGDIGTKEISVEDFRWMIGLDDSRYPRFNSLRERVIVPAIDQINKHSQFDVKVGYRKTMRRVTALQFAFKPKQKVVVKVEVEPLTLETNDFTKGCALFDILTHLKEGDSHCN